MKLQKATFEALTTARSWCQSEEEVQNWAGNVIQQSAGPEELRQYWDSGVENVANKEAWALVSDKGDLAGYAEIASIDPVHRSCRLEKFIIGPKELRGQGLGFGFLDLLKNHVFSELDAHRFELLVIERNAGARHLYEKSGFEVEGKLRDARFYAGEFHNMEMMACISMT
ncbi:GNAT family N-acetyltransferase [Hyphomonas johnsonii]|uniref:Aminoglycoside N6'-acetyltransferase n=1 Tax=Hyphomonas johnsonii MHS-2 TaxID=1280950 RepID=A0A059FV87_9PROT|nr:GNAT family protein [Hyphomonas johnsonii]KCZ94426.1 Aminoglycoside N6'-acetyltransferase [Hyphomonas johnsonii MHS-2]